MFKRVESIRWLMRVGKEAIVRVSKLFSDGGDNWIFPQV